MSLSLALAACATAFGGRTAPGRTSGDPPAAGPATAASGAPHPAILGSCDTLARGHPPLAADPAAEHGRRSERVDGLAWTLVRESLALSRGTVVRWPTEHMPIRVWIAAWDGVPRREVASGAEFVFAVAHAVRDWDGATPAVRLRVVHDSTDADVRIAWARRVHAGASGAADDVDGRSGVFHDARTGAITDAAITLSEVDDRGMSLTPRDVHAVAVHEIGHVLGLAHATTPRRGSADSRSVMASRIAAEEVAEVDRVALQIWYTLPIGASCDGHTASIPREGPRHVVMELVGGPVR